MENNNWVFGILIILSIWFWRDHHKLKNQVESLQSELAYTESALDQANSNIEEAQSWAWGSYDDMGMALDDLETVQP